MRDGRETYLDVGRAEICRDGIEGHEHGTSGIVSNLHRKLIDVRLENPTALARVAVVPVSNGLAVEYVDAYQQTYVICPQTCPMMFQVAPPSVDRETGMDGTPSPPKAPPQQPRITFLRSQS